MLDRNHNLNGDHGGDLLSYIYGEMDERSRSLFESHLAQCDECAVELGAISDARLGVVEWRRSDFDHLATPEIFIPQPESAWDKVAMREKAGFFAGLAELIGSVPVFAKAGVGLAVAALLIGVIYFSIAPRNREGEVTNGNFKAGAQVPPDSSPSTPDFVTPQQPEIANSNAKSVDKPVEKHYAVVPKRAVSSPQVAVNRMKRNVNRLGTETAKTPPRLNSFDDDEDQTLRLSDLFSQVGPVKR